MSKARVMIWMLFGISTLLLLYCRDSVRKVTIKSTFTLDDISRTENSNKLNKQNKLKIQRYGKYNEDPAFNLTLNPDKKIVLLVTSFRGGSTFLGQIFDSNPRMQYQFEPFHESYMINLYKKGRLIGARADHTISDLRMLYLQQIFHNCTLFRTVIVKEKHAFCGTPAENLHRFNSSECDETASEPGAAHHEICMYRPVTALKVIRLNDLSDILRIRNIRTANIKIVHLLRNPLPMMKSRRTGWNYFMWDSIKMLEFLGATAHENKIKQSYESFTYCRNSLKSIAFAKDNEWVKDRYLRVTHTAMSLQPLETAQKIYDFIEEELTDDIKTYIVNITRGHSTTESEDGKPKKKNPLEIRKNSAELVNQWKDLNWYLKFYDLFNIESQCKDLMELLGERFSVDSMSSKKLKKLLVLNQEDHQL
jgi:hypothetical protein